eukprot:CAMPEP_0181061482 /NCGR_PEP_ID=MMETSP1070-20121207/22550_1 /TAXON_ID=265543 /ORGANISM="Minutocellus polymorphus, Strain NH13" /LENGTH=101 /DNA_ID=CAMNT_0023141451 /DNA_START=108 /DNA_END=414 /DNA_ORIENTATION=+
MEKEAICKEPLSDYIDDQSLTHQELEKFLVPNDVLDDMAKLGGGKLRKFNPKASAANILLPDGYGFPMYYIVGALVQTDWQYHQCRGGVKGGGGADDLILV